MKEKIIDGEHYQFCLMMAGQSFEELIALLDVFGMSLGKLAQVINNVKGGIGNIDLDKLGESLDMGPVGDAIGILCSRLHEKKVLNIIRVYMEQVIHTGSNGKGQVSMCFDEHFKGRIFHMLKVFIAALGVQYSDFFGATSGVQSYASKIITTLGKQTSLEKTGSS